MIVYTDKWETVPFWLKTKTALTKLGFVPEDFGPVAAEMSIYGKTYPLYNFDVAVENAKKAGRKVAITTETNENFLLMDINVTGWEATDEVVELLLMTFEGKVVFHKWFKPQVAFSDKNKKFLRNPKLDKCLPIGVYWQGLQNLIEGKTIVVPNKFGVDKMLNQTLERYNLHSDVELNIVEGHSKIQQCFVTRMSLPEEHSAAILSKNCIELIKCLYPMSPLFAMQEEAKCSFNLLCNYNVRQGDQNSFSTGYTWIFKEFGERSKLFEDYSFDTCSGIVTQMHSALVALGLKNK